MTRRRRALVDSSPAENLALDLAPDILPRFELNGPGLDRRNTPLRPEFFCIPDKSLVWPDP